MKTVGLLVFRALLLITFITAYLYFLYGQGREHLVPIARNAARNDLVRQIDPSVDDSAHETLGTEVVFIQKFLREHPSEVNIHVYDIAVFQAIGRVRVRLQQADRNVETIRNELSYKEYRDIVGGDAGNGKQSSTAPSADSPSSRVRTLSDSRLLPKAAASGSIDDSMPRVMGKTIKQRIREFDSSPGPERVCS